MSFLRVSLISAILFSASTCNAQNSSILLRDFDVDEKVTDHQTLRGTVGVGVVVVHDGEIVYLQGYGDEDREANISVDPKETRFRWASIAKTFTGAIAVRAHTADIVDLDTHVSYCYPQYKVPKKYYVNGDKKDGQYLSSSQRHISMRRLLSHMSGIQHYSNGLSSPTPPNSRKNNPSFNTGMEWALKYWKYNPLIDKPGRRDSYSTPAYNLAGVILEKKMGLSFHQLVEIEIAGPAGMSTLRPDYVWSQAPRRAVGYFLSSGVATRDNRDNDVTWKLAAGGYVSTVEDMGKYAKAMLNNTILTNGEKQMMWNRQALSNGSTAANRGLGWVIRSGNYGDTNFKVSHGGAQEKARCYLSLFPDRGLAVGVMTNSSTNCDVRGLGEQIESVVLSRLNAGEPPITKGYQFMHLVAESFFPTYGYVTQTYRNYGN